MKASTMGQASFTNCLKIDSFRTMGMWSLLDRIIEKKKRHQGTPRCLFELCSEFRTVTVLQLGLLSFVPSRYFCEVSGHASDVIDIFAAAVRALVS